MSTEHNEHTTGPMSNAINSYARMVVNHPAKVLITIFIILFFSIWGTSKLTINSNQLDLISKDLIEIKDIKRVIDMVGGTGFLMLTLKGEDSQQLREVSDEINSLLVADTDNVRNITYKVPVEFIQEKMVLFVHTEDLIEGKRRINEFVRDQIRRASPTFIEIVQTEPVKLEMQDLVDKYSKIGKKSIREDYYLSEDKKMLLMLIKPMWDTNDLGKTKDYLVKLDSILQAYSAKNKFNVTLQESYSREVPAKGKISYGYTGSYKTNVDDSYAITESLEPVTIIALVGILLVTYIFFRRLTPSLIVVSGMAVGTLITMGFAYVTLHQLNMITSILGGILMGFGVDYGIQFVYRTRIELGTGKKYDDAVYSAISNAGRPALVAAVVTGGSFFVLMVSEFQGFSQFGFLAGFGTLIIALTLFAWSPAILVLAGRYNPTWPEKIVGTMAPPKNEDADGELRIPNPKLILSIAGLVVLVLCAFAVPWTNYTVEENHVPTMIERLKMGIRFNYNTRALIPDNQPSVLLQDEINDRFQISADPTAIYTKTLEEAGDIWNEFLPDKNKEDKDKKYPLIEQIVSAYSFVPPAETAAKNAEVLKEWEKELADIDTNAMPPDQQKNVEFFKKILSSRDDVPCPDIYTEFGKYTVGESGATILGVIGQKQQNDSELWYMVDNSLITTIPDAWAINERYIMLPINHWNKEYTRVNIGGLSCDNADYYNSEAHLNMVYLPKFSKSEDPLCVGFFHTGAYQDALSGYGGVKHCLLPSPKRILVDKDENGNYVDWMESDEQDAEAMLRLLGY